MPRHSSRSRGEYRSVRSTKLAPSIGLVAVRLMWSLIRTGVPGVPRRVQPSAAVGEHDRAAPGGGGGADTVHDRADPAALVEVRAPQEHEQVAVTGPDRADPAGVALDGGGRETGKVRGGELGGRLAERVGGRHPARAHHQGGVVGLDPGQLAEAFGRGAGEVDRGGGGLGHPGSVALTGRANGTGGCAARRCSRWVHRPPRPPRPTCRDRTPRAGRPRRRPARTSTPAAPRSWSRRGRAS